MKKESNTIKITSLENSDSLTSVIKLKILPAVDQPMNCGWSMPFVFKLKTYPTEKQIQRRTYELPMARIAQEHPLPPCIRTLLVDDSPFMLRTLAQVLAAEGRFKVVGSATDGCQALKEIAVLAPDLRVMDLHLSHLNGAQVTSYIKHFKNPPDIFIVTSDDSFSSRAMCTAAGADAFIVKSGDFYAQLTASLKDWFGLAANSCAQRGAIKPDK